MTFSKSVKDNLIVTATQLKRTAPEEWGAFFAALTAHIDETKDLMVESTPELLPQAQGRAMFGTALLRLLDDKDAAADKIVAQRNRPK